MPTLPYGSRMRVALKDCRFFANHGVLEQERCAGNEFKVSLEVTYTPGDILSDSLEGTISYADLYEIIKEQMAVSADLLETVAARIATIACMRWTQITEIRVSVTKITPPIPGCTGSAEVSFEYYR